MRKKIKDILLELGITPNLKGFDYICKTIDYMMTRKRIKMVEMYRIIAKDFETTPSAVERAIRTAFLKIDVESDVFTKYFGTDKITNSTLLHTLVYRLKED